MSTMNYIATSDELTSVADAIRTKGGTSSPLVFPAGFVSAIEDIPTGGTTVEPSDVNFIDYDGTIVAAYTAEEFAALDALPDNPTHEGLTAQGWNWSLSDAKTYVAECGMLWVGQMYVTDDGKTRVYIDLPGAALSPTLLLAVDGSAEVDWGDGSTTDTLTGSDTTTAVEVQHTYETNGQHVISIDVTGTAAIVGVYSYVNPKCILAGGYASYIKKIEIGNNIVSIGGYALSDASALSSVTIPSGVTSIGNNAFNNCYSLSSVTIPSGVTSIGDYAFSNCYVLSSVTIPSGVTSIGNSAFNNCYALSSVTIPSGVTSIGNSAFNNCYVLSSVTIPSGVTSIGNSAFNNCYALLSVTIPSGVTSIGNSAFNRCRSLAAVTIPDSVTAITASVFSECGAAESITVGAGVTSIANYAFQKIYSVKSIHFKPTTPPTIQGGGSSQIAFGDLPRTCIIYVPYSEDHSVLDAYKAATNYPSPSTYTYMEEPAS